MKLFIISNNVANNWSRWAQFGPTAGVSVTWTFPLGAPDRAGWAGQAPRKPTTSLLN